MLIHETSLQGKNAPKAYPNIIPNEERVGPADTKAPLYSGDVISVMYTTAGFVPRAERNNQKLFFCFLKVKRFCELTGSYSHKESSSYYHVYINC